MEYLSSPSVSETGIRSTPEPKNPESVLWLMSTEAAPTLEQGHKACRLKVLLLEPYRDGCLGRA